MTVIKAGDEAQALDLNAVIRRQNAEDDFKHFGVLLDHRHHFTSAQIEALAEVARTFTDTEG